jgi:kinetochore protein Spc24, fungi type
VNDSLSTLQQSRDLRTRDAETTLRKLSRQLSTLSSQHRETLANHNSGKHASEIVQLDTRKFRIAKQASELEAESERLEAELERLKMKLADLEEQGVEGDENTRRARDADDPTM